MQKSLAERCGGPPAPVVKTELAMNNICVLERPSQSADLNPIENLWRKVEANQPQSPGTIYQRGVVQNPSGNVQNICHQL